jgi:protein-S-isoprenylcysteine O-methyltransferase Ste14
MLNRASGVFFVMMVAGLAGLIMRKSIFSDSLVVIALQGAAAALMIWARITFGRRSFHATADPTAGGLVTDGPYRFIRHPIYTAVCVFVLAGVAAHPSPVAYALAALVVAGAVGRILAEESLLRERYPAYADYSKRTSRMVPFLF